MVVEVDLVIDNLIVGPKEVDEGRSAIWRALPPVLHHQLPGMI